MREVESSFYLKDLHSGSVYAENADAPFETGSAIKSPIGALALHDLLANGGDPDKYLLVVQRDHRSNGSGWLKSYRTPMPAVIDYDDRLRSGRCLITMSNLLELNIVESDCTATNTLIEYLGGSDGVNKGLEEDLGLTGIRLLTDKINFPGVDHDKVPFQVGATTMAALGRYYELMAKQEALFGDLPLNRFIWFADLHAKVQDKWLLNPDVCPDMVEHHWYHKTGSVIDRSGDVFYASVADAGNLYLAGKAYTIASAMVQPQTTTKTNESLAHFEDDFTERSLEGLRATGVPIIETYKVPLAEALSNSFDLQTV